MDTLAVAGVIREDCDPDASLLIASDCFNLTFIFTLDPKKMSIFKFTLKNITLVILLALLSFGGAAALRLLFSDAVPTHGAKLQDKAIESVTRTTGQPSYRDTLTASVPPIVQSDKVPVKIRSLANLAPHYDSHLRVLNNLGSYISKAKSGDSQSSVAIFRTAEWCVDQRAEWNRMQLDVIRGIENSVERSALITDSIATCRRLTKDVEEERFAFLAQAGNQGDVHAMLAFERALFQLPMQDPAWVWRNSERISMMRDQAIRFLEEAARQGIYESYVELSGIYATGKYGVIDNALANWYLSQIPKNFIKQPLQD